MALVLKDRVRETTTTTGTGTITLAGAVTGYQSFSVIGNANTTYYSIVDAATGAWETGIGTWSTGGTLARSVLQSSNANALVSFAAGTKDVFGTFLSTAVPAGAIVGTTDTQTLSAKTVTGLRETRVAMAANDVNLLLGNYFTKTITVGTTFTVSNVPAAATAQTFILDLTNGGSQTITWWTGMKWTSGAAPTLTAAGRDVLGFFTHDGGTTWTGLLLGRDVK